VTDPFAPFPPDPATQAAVAAARTVADATRAVYRPLVVTGARGAGKSLLLRAIRDRALAASPPRQVELISLGRLADAVTTRSLQEGGAALRDRLLRADLLLIDDFESVGRHLPVQGFMVDVVEGRFTLGRDVVVATSVPPEGLQGLDPRLARRVESGTRVELGLPGRDTRIALLRERAAAADPPLAPGVAEAVADLDLGSIKEYLGALNRIVAFQQASPDPLPPAEALALIGIEPESPPAPPVEAAAPPADGSPLGAEFESFVSEIVANVTQQFDHWRGRLRQAIGHWQTVGIRTRRLERAVAGELEADPEPLITEFGRDAAELQRLLGEVRVIAPDLAGAELFKDPDQLGAARRLVEEARARRAPLSAPLADLALAALGIGPSNRLALEAAHAVIEEPGIRYNPLVLVGPSGVGKTHLLHAIGNALIERGASPIVCLSAHSFLGELAQHKSPEEIAFWRARYQWVAALLVDDIHLLARETQAQEEFLQLFAALAEGNRPMVLSTARRLSDLEGFDPRLLNRLEGGLVVEISAPDRDVRLAVVKQLLGGTPAGGDAALIDYLAGRPADSVRAVQGTVQRVLGEAAAQRVTPSTAFAREVLEVVEGKAARPPRRPAPPASGILSPGLGVVKSREKMVPAWPFAADLLIGELR
jgi:chromosomal replication initiation ATPase DnaA